MAAALMKIPQGTPNKFVKDYVSIKRRFANLKDKGEEVAEAAIRSTEVAATAVALGVIPGSSKDGPAQGVKFGEVPIDLIVAGSMYVGALAGVGGKYSSHLKNFGDGALASYLAVWGRGMGAKWRAKRGTSSSGAGLGAQLDALLD